MRYNKPTFLNNNLKSNVKNYIRANGRNNKGRITVWHKGNGHQHLYRKIDLHRKDTHGIVIGLEYDPNRKAFLARVFNPDTKKNNYILAPTNIEKGQVIRSNSEHNKNGYSQKLRYVPTGQLIYNIPIKSGHVGQISRAPGSFGKLIKKTQQFGQIELKSGYLKWLNIDTIVSLGIVSNTESQFKKLKKAGQSRWLGKRPTVRGVAMNPVDHPHGGGEGKSSGGRPSVTPWGKPTKGKPTRQNKFKHATL